MVKVSNSSSLEKLLKTQAFIIIFHGHIPQLPLPHTIPKFPSQTIKEMQVSNQAHDLSQFTFPLSSLTKTTPMRTALSLLRTTTTHHHRRLLLTPLTFPLFTTNPSQFSLFNTHSAQKSSVSNFVEHLAGEDENLNFDKDTESFDFDACFGSSIDEPKNFNSPPPLDVKELDELPEQWRRSKLAWLCKELPSHKPATLIRILNAQRKWVNQEDMTYVAVHCMRIRENETGFRVKSYLFI